jgi:4-hydroxymandelate oxidase
MSTTMPAPVNLHEYEALAAAALPAMAWDYYRSGACDELTLARNQRAFDALCLRYRVLVDVSRRSTGCTLLGRSLALPVLIAPTAFHGLAHAEAELATARAAAEAGTTMVLSTLSNTRVEDVTACTSADVWFQLYVYRDRGATRALVERVRAAGCKALVLTVDAPLLGRRERDVRNRFALPDGLRIENMLAAGMGDVPPRALDSGLAAYFAELIDPALSFADVTWLASLSALPVIVKGVVRGDDARLALDAGARAVVVSNHGGRQLDTSIATADALAEVVDAVGDRGEVLVDGGVRRGSDVLKALALGARAVLVGRPILWGLAAGGSAGASRALAILRSELELAMLLAGAADVTDLTRDLLEAQSLRRIRA